MSFILDALKKSELERQRQAMPGLIDATARPARKRLPTWAIALGALLAVNLIVLAVVLLRAGGAPPSAAGASGAATGETAKTVPAETPAKPFSPLDATAEYAPEIPVQQPADAAPQADAAPRAGAVPPLVGTPRTAAHAASSDRAAQQPDPLLTDAADDEVLPALSEMNIEGLSDLHIDVHVYSTKPSERFVYINMRKYHEGAILPQGPKLELIRRDGAVLSYQGVRFLLPRQ